MSYVVSTRSAEKQGFEIPLLPFGRPARSRLSNMAVPLILRGIDQHRAHPIPTLCDVTLEALAVEKIAKSTTQHDGSDTHFSPLERSVVALAANPRERPVPRTWIARFFRRLFHGAAATPLACPRLEALRQVAACCHADLQGQLPDDVEAAFISAGWRMEDVNVVRTIAAESAAS